MEELMKQLGLAKGLLENADDPGELKKALEATLKALEIAATELQILRQDHDELDDYVAIIDDDLSSLEYDMDDDMDDFDEDDDELFDMFDDEDDDDYIDSDEDKDGKTGNTNGTVIPMDFKKRGGKNRK